VAESGSITSAETILPVRDLFAAIFVAVGMLFDPWPSPANVAALASSSSCSSARPSA
jgi:predicted Kef-type K+ transport protein